MQLNSEQQKARDQISWPLLILAGAGSGKTATLTARIEYMIQSWVDPSNILALTFTNKAAKEMKHRVAKVLGVEYEINPYKNRNLPFIGTFHSFWVYLLKERIESIGWKKEFVIYDETDKLSIIKSIIKEDLGLDEKKYPPRSFAGAISNAKNALVDVANYQRQVTGHFQEIAANVYERYTKRLAENSALDFDDILIFALEILKVPENLAFYQNRYQYLMVDEYQDTNQPQYQIIKLLASKYQNLAVVGDDWQCLLPQTQVRTETGTLPIENIQVWQKVLSYSGGQEQRFYEVKEVYSNTIDEEIYTITTNTWRVIETTGKHIFFSNPEADYNSYQYAVYLMYKEWFGFRVGFTRYKWLSQKGKILGIRKRLNGERADYAWILETTSNPQKAKYFEQYYSYAYAIPQTVFYAKGKLVELTQEDIWNIYQNINTEWNASKLFQDLHLSKDYPHIIASSTNRFDSLCANIHFFMMGWNTTNRRFWMYRVSLHTSHPSMMEVLSESFPKYCRKSKYGIRIDKESADYEKIFSLAQEMYQVLKKSGFSVILHERLSFLNESYIFTPAMNLRAWFALPVFDDTNNTFQTEYIEKIEKVPYSWVVYDLNIQRTHNFIANGMVLHNSIYSWRGADMRNIINFKKDYPQATVIKLEQNYRSTKHIIEAANVVIKNNKTALDKTLFTHNEEGEKILLIDAPSDRIEASTIIKIIKEKGAPYSQNLILYRTNAQSRGFEESLMTQWVPYRVVGGLKFYDRMEVKDLLAYLKVIHNPNDVIGMKRIINTPSRKIGATTLSKLDFYRANFGVSYLQILENIDEVDELNAGAKKSIEGFYALLMTLRKDSTRMVVSELLESIVEKIGYKEYLQTEYSKDEYEAKVGNISELITVASEYNGMEPRDSLSQFLEEVSLLTDMDAKGVEEKDMVTLMTIHTSKGLEYERVFVTWLEDGLFPSSRTFVEPKELEEERRLMYVAMTRAKKELIISRAQERFTFWEFMHNPPSRFLAEIPETCVENYVFEIGKTLFSSTPTVSSFSGFDTQWVTIKKPLVKNDPKDYSVGMYVEHHKFWVGKILSLSGEIADINFSSPHGTKKMNIVLAPLKIVS